MGPVSKAPPAWQGKAARRIWWIRTARGQSERGGNISRVRLDRSQKTPSNQLIQPGRSNICERSSPPIGLIPRLVDQDPWAQLRRPMDMIRQG